MTHDVRVEAELVARVRDWLRREGPRLAKLDSAELTIQLRDSGYATDDGEMIIHVETFERSHAEGFMGGLDGVRGSEDD